MKKERNRKKMQRINRKISHYIYFYQKSNFLQSQYNYLYKLKCRVKQANPSLEDKKILNNLQEKFEMDRMCYLLGK